MNQKQLTVLIGAAVVALGVAVAINVANKPVSEGSEQTKALLPQLHGHVNDVDAIVLTGAEGKVLATLKRGADGWTVAEKSGYPADLAKVREFLLKLDQATLLEQKTSNPQHYAELGVDEVKNKDAKGVEVELHGLNPAAKLIVGTYNGAGGGGTFVRLDGQTESWLAKGNLAVDKNVADWEQRDLTDIASTRIVSITTTAPDGKVLKVYKENPGDANFKVADVPKGRETSSEFAANGLGSTLAGLKADDAFPAKEQAPPEKVYKADYAMADGLVVSVTAWDANGKDFAQLKAHLDAAAADAAVVRDQAKAKADYEASVQAANKTVAEGAASGQQADAAAKQASAVDNAKPLAVSDPAKDKAERLKALQSEVERLNKTFDGWTFALPSYKYSNIAKSMDDLLKPVETKKPEAPAKPAKK